MRVLLDESVPRKLARELADHDVKTVTAIGWAGTKNGALLRRAVAEGFEVLVTVDRNLEHQQNIAKAGIGLVVLVGRSNRLADLLPLLPGLLNALASISAGKVVRVAV